MGDSRVWGRFIMRVSALLTLLVLSTPSFALGYDDARHLLLRTGFGPEQTQVETLLLLNREQAVAYLLSQKPVFLEAPDCIADTTPPQSQRKHWSDEERQSFQKLRQRCNTELRRGYVEHLFSAPDVLHQRMTLFWHNHFTSSMAKVQETALIYRQHQLLVSHALGNFRVMLHGILNDPAMLIYLDNVNNNRNQPNENLARELLELFTLGEGHYTEQDIKAAARALTGQGIERETFGPRFYPNRHDYGEKTILGERGHFGPEGLAELLLRQPRTAQFITRKLWLEFVSTPDEAQIDRLAREFGKNWDIKALVRGILLTESFWMDQGRMVKSPVELVLGTARLVPGMRLPVNGTPALLNRMGQQLFSPPNVKGWPTGAAWVDASRLMVRINFVERMLRGLKQEYMGMEQAYLCAGAGPVRLSAVPPDQSQQALEPMDFSEQGGCLEALAATLLDPVWQLK